MGPPVPKIIISYRRAAQHRRGLSAMMIEETGDWKVLYESHEIHGG